MHVGAEPARGAIPVELRVEVGLVPPAAPAGGVAHAAQAETAVLVDHGAAHLVFQAVLVGMVHTVLPVGLGLGARSTRPGSGRHPGPHSGTRSAR